MKRIICAIIVLTVIILSTLAAPAFAGQQTNPEDGYMMIEHNGGCPSTIVSIYPDVLGKNTEELRDVVASILGDRANVKIGNDKNGKKAILFELPANSAEEYEIIDALQEYFNGIMTLSLLKRTGYVFKPEFFVTTIDGKPRIDVRFMFINMPIQEIKDDLARTLGVLAKEVVIIEPSERNHIMIVLADMNDMTEAKIKIVACMDTKLATIDKTSTKEAK